MASNGLGDQRAPAEDQWRGAIKIARFICILGITYTHVWIGLSFADFQAQKGSATSIIYWSFVELLGRSSVPLLSIISGWLVVGSVAKRGYAPFINGKARTLLAPMIFWNMVALAATAAAIEVGVLAPETRFSLGNILNELTHLVRAGVVNYPTAFLRDMFVCMLAAPVLVRLPMRWLAMLLALALIWSLGLWNGYLLLRPQILLFFLIGIMVRRAELTDAVARLPLPPILVAFTLIGMLKIALSVSIHDTSEPYSLAYVALDNLLRFIAAIVFWRICLALSKTHFALPLCNLEKYAFLLFCSHLVVVQAAIVPVRYLDVQFGDPAWLLFFFLQPAIALAGAIVIGKLMSLCWAPLADLASGGRLAQKKAPGKDAFLQADMKGYAIRQ